MFENQAPEGRSIGSQVMHGRTSSPRGAQRWQVDA